MKKSRVSQGEPAGNTNTAGQKPPNNQCYRWQFTLAYKGDPNEPEELAALLRPFCKEFYFQLEKGKESGYFHFQGCLSLITKHRLTEVKNIIRHDVHLEPALNWFALKNYSKKDETYVAGPWDHTTCWIKLPKELFPWQKQVVELIEKDSENDRVIYWFWDSEGCKGKTTLCKYLISKHGACMIDGGYKDIAYSLPDNPKIVLMNITRTTEGHVNYKALEAVKDGLVFSSKYESRCKIFNSPHVLVFANFQPDFESMSKDRWLVHRLDE